MDDNFSILKKAKDLAQFTTVATSKKDFPKRYSYSIATKAQNYSIELCLCILNANSMDAYTEKAERYRLQTEAINLCNAILILIEMSMNLSAVSADCANIWSQIAKDVKHMTLAWRQKTSKSNEQ